MKKALLFLLCTIFLLTACNADTPKDTQSSDTVPPSIESTAESQPTESTDDTYFLFSMTQTDSTVFSPTFESFIKENYGELMQKVPDLLSRCINVTPSELSDTIELYRFGYARRRARFPAGAALCTPQRTGIRAGAPSGTDSHARAHRTHHAVRRGIFHVGCSHHPQLSARAGGTPPA